MTDFFRHDNTEGYTAADLKALNAAFEAACWDARLDQYGCDEVLTQNAMQHIGEQVQAEYDAR